MTFAHIAMQVASAVALQELEFSRVLRYPPKACYDRAFAVLDETYIAAFAVARPPTLTRFRPMEKS